MKSKWYKLKSEALRLRRGGRSIRSIEKSLSIRRSTLSYWFSKIKLTEEQKKKLFINWQNALVKARKKAVVWHREQKEKRLKAAQLQAEYALKNFRPNDKKAIELALAFLYLGEGLKSSAGTSLSSSNPLILRFFIRALYLVYGLRPTLMRCGLHIRADQKPLTLKKYWSKVLGVPLKNFRNVAVDYRTKGITTYPYYKGVCVVSCSHTNIQRKLLAMANIFCERVSANGRVAQLVRALH